MKCSAIAIMLATYSPAAEIKGAGPTFVLPVMAEWSAVYRAKTGNSVSYQAVSSGLGISLIKKAAVDFYVSDMPLKPEQLDKLGMTQFPLVIDGVVPVVHIEGVKPGEMRFTGQLLADIFLGKIRNWNHPDIQKINPQLKLPDLAITVVHRVDSSGTTFHWSNYLSKVSPEWKASIGEGAAVEWRIGIGGKGNDGVASLVGMVPGSIGYLEYGYTLQKIDRISFGVVQNSAGNFVNPDVETFQAAALSTDWTNTRDFFLVMTDAPGANAFPITAAMFVLMQKYPKSPTNAAIAREFLRLSIESGQRSAESHNYEPLPSSLVQKIEVYWNDNSFGFKGNEAVYGHSAGLHPK